jgi:hypothetical protein
MDVRRASDGHPSWAVVDDSHILQTSAGGGGGGKLSDIVLTDDSATEFIARDDGTTITYVTLAGVLYVPTTNVRTKSTSSAQLPASLGAKAGSASLSITPATDGVFTIYAPNVPVAATDIHLINATVTGLGGGLSTMGIQITGDGTGFHITPQASMDNGATWVNVGVIASGAAATSASISDITATGNYLFSTGGYDHFRLFTATGITGGATLSASLNATYSNKLFRAAGIGDQADTAAASDTGAASLVALMKRWLANSRQIAITQTTLAVTASSQTLIAANAARKYLAWMVIGTADVTVSPASPAVVSVGKVYQAAGAGLQGASEDFNGLAPTGAFYAIASATGSTVIVWEGV